MAISGINDIPGSYSIPAAKMAGPVRAPSALSPGSSNLQSAYDKYLSSTGRPNMPDLASLGSAPDVFGQPAIWTVGQTGGGGKGGPATFGAQATPDIAFTDPAAYNQLYQQHYVNEDTGTLGALENTVADIGGELPTLVGIAQTAGSLGFNPFADASAAAPSAAAATAGDTAGLGTGLTDLSTLPENVGIPAATTPTYGVIDPMDLSTFGGPADTLRTLGDTTGAMALSTLPSTEAPMEEVVVTGQAPTPPELPTLTMADLSGMADAAASSLSIPSATQPPSIGDPTITQGTPQGDFAAPSDFLTPAPPPASVDASIYTGTAPLSDSGGDLADLSDEEKARAMAAQASQDSQAATNAAWGAGSKAPFWQKALDYLETPKGALSAVGLGYNVLQQNKANKLAKQAQGQEQQAASGPLNAGNQLLDQYKAGKLSPADQASITQWQNASVAQAKQYFANAGMADSTAALQTVRDIGVQADQMRQSALNNYLKQGLDAIGVAQGPISQQVNQAIAADQRSQQSMQDLFQALGILASAESTTPPSESNA